MADLEWSRMRRPADSANAPLLYAVRVHYAQCAERRFKAPYHRHLLSYVAFDYLPDRKPETAQCGSEQIPGQSAFRLGGMLTVVASERESTRENESERRSHGSRTTVEIIKYNGLTK